ncbi:unnamed protein product [Diamesa serratosioi]
MMNSKNISGDYKVLPQVLVTLAANGGAFIFGILLGWSAPVGPEITNKDYEFPVSTNEFAWIVSLIGIGGACSSILSGIVMRKLGIKRTILVFNIPILAAWIILIFARSSILLMLGRFFIGLSIGCYCYVLPIYIGEISSNEIRGSLLSTFQVFLNVGVVFVFIVGYFVNLRVLNVICGILPVFYTISFLFLPESPGILVRKNKIAKAEKSIQRLRGTKYDLRPEIEEIQMQQETIKKVKNSFAVEFKKKATFKAFIVIIGLFFFFQMSGIDAVTFYTTTIFIEAGVQLDPAVATITLGLMQVIANALSIIAVDRLGRKFLLILSSVGMFIGLIGIGIYFSFKNGDPMALETYKWLPLPSLSIFVISFSVGMGPIPFILLGELFSPDAKKVIAPIAQTMNFVMSFIIGLVYPFLTESLGTGPTFYMFSGFTFLGILFTIFVIPETKGQSLVEIQNLLTN